MDASKTLRDYQERLVFNFSRTAEDILVEQPTGSGKTVQIVTLVAMHLGKRFSHAVISAPQEQIEQGFVKRDYSVVAFPERRGVAVPSIQVPKNKTSIPFRAAGRTAARHCAAMPTWSQASCKDACRAAS